MAEQRVEVQQRIDAPRQAVWDRYADFPGWSRWAGLGSVHLERPGDPPPGGSGCIRVFRAAGLATREEILDFEPPKRLSYRLLAGGLPIRDHLGEVLFEEEAGGTRVVWRCRFRSALPGLGRPLRALVARVFRRTLERLARQPFPPVPPASESS